MALVDKLRDVAAALLGISAYDEPSAQWRGPDKETVNTVRRSMGGNIQPLPTPRLRWYIEQLDAAMIECDSGNITRAAQLCRAMNRDGVFKGLLKQRTKGLIRLPKRFYGSDEVANVLKARNGSRSVFDEMHPPSELQLLDGDGIKLGIGVAEYVPVKGRDYPVLVRLQPEYLNYRWNENRWYFQSLAGNLPITPGDGRWVLHIPGGRLTPWESGDWYALGRAFINKEHAIQYRANYSAKLANPARILESPLGATEIQRIGIFRKLLAWGTNNVYELPVGWKASLLESNGRGWEVFQRQIDTSDNEFMITLAGQTVTTTGGSGFANADVPAAIRQDLIQGDGDDLSYTINTQGLPAFIVRRWGLKALEKATILEWDTGTPSDKEKETRVLGQAAQAIEALTKSLKPYKKIVDINEMTTRFGVAVLDIKEEVGEKDIKLDLAPTDVAKVVKVDEARQSQGLEPIGDERGDMTINELDTPDPTPEGQSRGDGIGDGSVGDDDEGDTPQRQNGGRRNDNAEKA